ncbi:tellurium resistance protein [Beggiatoa leptomitoformis]|uniref:Tellurium resistance protein n=2 Tax=Beggiatoa leptomitoformis TaxID=288004 RepID=A0A2N9YJK5_9GAMM|nr:tellurium resistance protein [Beggiatoa leptomitoformis]AUI70682.2 tellurium resistance protein [Beggiatoa leptomitoformis]
MSPVIPVPEGEVAKRPLHFFWLTDYSGSMSGKKIAVLNQAIREALPEIRKALINHPQVQIMMRAIKFSDTAAWHVGPTPVSLEQFSWPELGVAGLTATAQAIHLLADELQLEKMPRRGLPPVCLLVSDGFCTDTEEEYLQAIRALDSQPWGKKAVRLAIAIGDETDYDEEQLLKFVSHREIGVLKAHNPAELLEYIKWASITASIGASQGKSKGSHTPDAVGNVVLTPPPQPILSASEDVF